LRNQCPPLVECQTLLGGVELAIPTEIGSLQDRSNAAIILALHGRCLALTLMRWWPRIACPRIDIEWLRWNALVDKSDGLDPFLLMWSR
jgi:hypothetical protein